MVDQHEVIDWNQAMEQVDNDEEFLFELLDDFAEELDSKMMILHGCMNVSVGWSIVTNLHLLPFEIIIRHIVPTILHRRLTILESCLSEGFPTPTPTRSYPAMLRKQTLTRSLTPYVFISILVQHSSHLPYFIFTSIINTTPTTTNTLGPL